MRLKNWRTANVDPDAHYERALARHEAEQDRLEDEAFDFVECQTRIARQLAAAIDDPRGLGDGCGL